MCVRVRVSYGGSVQLGDQHVLLIISAHAIGLKHSLRPNVIPCKGLQVTALRNPLQNVTYTEAPSYKPTQYYAFY